MKPYRDFFKRFFDFVVSGSALIILALPLGMIALWLFIANKGAGAFFVQERPGLNNKIFKVIKFKTMTDERDAEGYLLPDSLRLTKIGKILRSTSIDELPQLWNVFKGDMSMIGPRPLLTWFLPLYDKRQIHRHDVRPGITGWAQVNGRNCLTYRKKFEYDLWYVNNISCITDIKIICLTIKNVLAAKDVASGIDDVEVDDLNWHCRQKEAEELFEKYYR